MHNHRRLKVGVTLYLRAGPQSLWENGIFQNVFFLTMLLNKSPVVCNTFLVNGGNGRPENAIDFLAMAPAPIIDLETAMCELDVIIELSAQLNPRWAAEFRARGGKVVGMRVANDYAIDIERMIFDRPQGMLVSGTPYDVVWMLPAFERTCRSYYESALRAPVRVMQHLWNPVLLEHSIKASDAELPFGYIPSKRNWRIAILEPNICTVKTSHIPLLITDIAYRDAPWRIENVRVFNTIQLKDDPIFFGFCSSLDIVRHGKATFESRFATYEIMSLQADAIISHHWENGQNYLYYEALYGSYPLVHNSNYLDGCGYKYLDFDCSDGASALLQAYAEHDLTLSDYKSNAANFLQRLDPECEKNVTDYSAALMEL